MIANPLLNASQGYGRGFDRFEVRPPGTPEWDGEAVVDRGLAQLAGRGPRPFFLYLHLFDPHYPYEPAACLDATTPRDDAARRAAFTAALPPEQRELMDDAAYRGIESLIALYDGEIACADRALGRLFGALEAEGLAEDTLVVLTSDHGEGLWQRAPAEGEELKTQVFFPQLYYSHGVQLYSEQVHVPLILRGPGVEAGTVEPADVSLLDVVPTVLELAGVPAPDGFSGVSLVSSASRGGDGAIYSVCSRLTTVTVDGRWRLHVPREHRVERFGARPELYDLSSDPLELEPLEDPERAAGMIRMVAAWRARHAGGPAPEIDAEQRALLESLGYAGEADR